MNLIEKMIDKLKGLAIFILLLIFEGGILQYNKINFDYLGDVFFQNNSLFIYGNSVCKYPDSQCSAFDSGIWKVIDFLSFLLSGSYKMGLLFILGIIVIFFLWWIFNKVKNFITFSSSLFLGMFLILFVIFFKNTISLTVILLAVISLGWLILGFAVSIFHFIDWGLNKLFQDNSDDTDQTDSPLVFFDNPKNKNEEKRNSIGIQKMEDLGYKQIALQLSERLKGLKANSSSEVIGIEGEWGSGKTSFIHLVKFYTKQKQQIFFPKDLIGFKFDNSRLFKFEFYFKYRDLEEFIQERFFPEHPPSFLEFNPWHFESTNNLLESFFPSLSEHIESEYHISTGSAFLSFVQSIGIESEHEFFGVKFKWGNTPTSPGYKEERDKINTILGSLEYPIIVVIDDLDRINLEQCKQIFQLIYLCTDLKNVHFLVSYDSEKFNSIAVPAFDTFDKDGFQSENFHKTDDIRLYIEKIIHSKISLLPLIDGLKGMLYKIILITFKVPEDQNNKERIIVENSLHELLKPSVFFEIYKEYLANPRKIGRINNVLKNIIDSNKYVFRYGIMKNEMRFVIFIKILLIYIYHYPIFKEIFFELQSVDISGFDDKYYRKTLFLNGYRNVSNESEQRELKKTLDSYLQKYGFSKQLLLKDLLRYSETATPITRNELFTDEDTKIAIGVIVGFYSMDDANIDGFSEDVIEKLKENSTGLSVYLKKMSESDAYNALMPNEQEIIKELILNDEKRGKIIEKSLQLMGEYIRDNITISESWIKDFYTELFHKCKYFDFPQTINGNNFKESFLGKLTDSIGSSVYYLIFWMKNKATPDGQSHSGFQSLIASIFDNEKIFNNWSIFGLTSLIGLWSILKEPEYTNLISQDTRTWTARFIYKIFQKFYIEPRKSFLTDNPIINRYWINYVKYQCMSEKEMGNILISDGSTVKIGELIGKYFQDTIYTDTQFSDIGILFGYLVVMSYSYSDEFRGRYLHYSSEADWNSNPFMRKILRHFQSRIEAYVQAHPDKEFEVNARYNGYEPRKFIISEIWENLKKVTNLVEES